MTEKVGPVSPFGNNPLAKAILREGLLIQGLDIPRNTAAVASSLAGHIVAGVASDEEVSAFRKFCEALGS